MKQLRVGIIGTGGISHSHMAAYQKLNHVSVAAVCDLNEERVREYAAAYQVPHSYTDYREMLETEELDAVSVTTWNNAHGPVSIAAMKAGCHVLCEKPLSMNTAEALEMQRTAQETGKLLMVGFVRRFYDNAEIAKEMIESGELGRIYYAKTNCIRRCGNPCGWFADKARSGGGPLIDLGVHMIDLSRYLMGKPKADSVYGAVFDGIGPRTNIRYYDRYMAADFSEACDVEDFASAMVRFDNGAVLQVEVSFSAHTQKEGLSLELLGTKGGITIEPALAISSEKNSILMNLTPVISHPADVFATGFDREIAHFTDCVQKGTLCRNPVEDGVELMRILDAVYQSAASGREVRLSEMA